MCANWQKEVETLSKQVHFLMCSMCWGGGGVVEGGLRDILSQHLPKLHTSPCVISQIHVKCCWETRPEPPSKPGRHFYNCPRMSVCNGRLGLESWTAKLKPYDRS